jgi:hypothetical protein
MAQQQDSSPAQVSVTDSVLVAQIDVAVVVLVHRQDIQLVQDDLQRVVVPDFVAFVVAAVRDVDLIDVVVHDLDRRVHHLVERLVEFLLVLDGGFLLHGQLVIVATRL